YHATPQRHGPPLLGFWPSLFPRGLAIAPRPFRVGFPTDWKFTSCAPQPRLAPPQYRLVTARKRSAGRGLAPLCFVRARRRTRGKSPTCRRRISNFFLGSPTLLLRS